MARLSINEASKEWKIARTTLQKKIKSGEITTTSTTSADTSYPKNTKFVDTSDLIRVFGEPHGVVESMLKDKVIHDETTADTMTERFISSLEKQIEHLKNEVEHYRDESIKDKEKIEALESEIRAFSSAGFFKRLSYKR